MFVFLPTIHDHYMIYCNRACFVGLVVLFARLSSCDFISSFPPMFPPTQALISFLESESGIYSATNVYTYQWTFFLCGTLAALFHPIYLRIISPLSPISPRTHLSSFPLVRFPSLHNNIQGRDPVLNFSSTIFCPFPSLPLYFEKPWFLDKRTHRIF